MYIKDRGTKVRLTLELLDQIFPLHCLPWSSSNYWFGDRSAAAAAGTSWSLGKMSGCGPTGVMLCIGFFESVVAARD